MKSLFYKKHFINFFYVIGWLQNNNKKEIQKVYFRLLSILIIFSSFHASLKASYIEKKSQQQSDHISSFNFLKREDASIKFSFFNIDRKPSNSEIYGADLGSSLIPHAYKNKEASLINE